MGLQEFFDASKCLFVDTIKSIDNVGNNYNTDRSFNNSRPGLQQLLNDKCRCDYEHTQTYKSHTGYQRTFELSSLESSVLECVDRLSAALTKRAIPIFLDRIAEFEARLGRRVLCDDALETARPRKTRILENVTDAYHSARSKFQ